VLTGRKFIDWRGWMEWVGFIVVELIVEFVKERDVIK